MARQAVPHVLDRRDAVAVRRSDLGARAAADRGRAPRRERRGGRPPHRRRLGAERRLALRRQLGRPAPAEALAADRRRPRAGARPPHRAARLPPRRAHARAPLRGRAPHRLRSGALLDRLPTGLRRPRAPRPVPRGELEAERVAVGVVRRRAGGGRRSRPARDRARGDRRRRGDVRRLGGADRTGADRRAAGGERGGALTRPPCARGPLARVASSNSGTLPRRIDHDQLLHADGERAARPLRESRARALGRNHRAGARHRRRRRARRGGAGPTSRRARRGRPGDPHRRRPLPGADRPPGARRWPDLGLGCGARPRRVRLGARRDALRRQPERAPGDRHARRGAQPRGWCLQHDQLRHQAARRARRRVARRDARPAPDARPRRGRRRPLGALAAAVADSPGPVARRPRRARGVSRRPSIP